MSSLPSECRIGLRDWSAVVDAIGQGKQTILIRRGRPAHDQFVLLPTYTFANERDFLSKHFQKGFHALVEKSVADKDTRSQSATFFAKVERVITIGNAELSKLRRIENRYVWTPDHVIEYFQRTPNQDAFIWILRAYKIPHPTQVTIPRGPVVYVHLDPPISLEGVTPILSESEYTSIIEGMEAELSQPHPITGVEPRLLELEAKVMELSRQLEERDRRLEEISVQHGKEPIDEVIVALRSANEQNFLQFEWSVARAFRELGFNSHWNGREEGGKPVETAPKGRADVEVEAPLAGEPYYMVVEATKVADAASQATELSRMAIRSLKVTSHKLSATIFRLLVAPRFTPQIEELCYSFKERVNLMAMTDLLRLLEFHRSIGGITQEEFRRLLDAKERGHIATEVISDWEDAVREERENLALLLDTYSVLFENAKEWMTTDIIHFLLKKDRRPGISEKEVEEAIGILKAPVIDAVSEKIEGGRSKFKASMTPQTFHMRIRKLDEEILKHRSKSELRLPGKISSYTT